jgi:hypothetical protein
VLMQDIPSRSGSSATTISSVLAQDIPSRFGSSATTNSSESVKYYHAQRHGPSSTNAFGQGDIHYQCKMHTINTNKFRIAK